MALSSAVKKLRPHAERAGWAVVDQAISPVLMLVMTPLLLRYLGAEQFGLWMLVMTFVAMGQLISLGAATATIKHVSADLGVGNHAAAVATIRAAIALTLMVGGAVCLLVTVLSPLVASYFLQKMGAVALVAQALSLAFVLLTVQELDSVFSSALRGAQRYDLSAKVEVLFRLLWAVAVVLLAWRTHSVLVVIYAALLLSLVKVWAKAWCVNDLLNVAHCHVPAFERQYLRRVADFGKWQWLQSMGGILFSVMDRLLVGMFFGASDLTRYGICMQFAQYVHALPSMAIQVVLPAISAKVERGEPITQLKLFQKAIFIGAVCFAAALPVLLLAPWLLKLWLGATFAAQNALLLQVLIAGYAVLAINIPLHYFLVGLGQIKLVSLVNLTAGFVTALATLLLINHGLLWVAATKLIYAAITLSCAHRLKEISKQRSPLSQVNNNI